MAKLESNQQVKRSQQGPRLGGGDFRKNNTAINAGLEFVNSKPSSAISKENGLNERLNKDQERINALRQKKMDTEAMLDRELEGLSDYLSQKNYPHPPALAPTAAAFEGGAPSQYQQSPAVAPSTYNLTHIRKRLEDDQEQAKL